MRPSLLPWPLDRRHWELSQGAVSLWQRARSRVSSSSGLPETAQVFAWIAHTSTQLLLTAVRWIFKISAHEIWEKKGTLHTREAKNYSKKFKIHFLAIKAQCHMCYKCHRTSQALTLTSGSLAKEGQYKRPQYLANFILPMIERENKEWNAASYCERVRIIGQWAANQTLGKIEIVVPNILKYSQTIEKKHRCHLWP